MEFCVLRIIDRSWRDLEVPPPYEKIHGSLQHPGDAQQFSGFQLDGWIELLVGLVAQPRDRPAKNRS